MRWLRAPPPVEVVVAGSLTRLAVLLAGEVTLGVLICGDLVCALDQPRVDCTRVSRSVSREDTGGASLDLNRARRDTAFSLQAGSLGGSRTERRRAERVSIGRRDPRVGLAVETLCAPTSIGPVAFGVRQQHVMQSRTFLGWQSIDDVLQLVRVAQQVVVTALVLFVVVLNVQGVRQSQCGVRRRAARSRLGEIGIVRIGSGALVLDRRKTAPRFGSRNIIPSEDAPIARVLPMLMDRRWPVPSDPDLLTVGNSRLVQSSDPTAR